MSAAPKSGSSKGEAKVLSAAEIVKDLIITAFITFPILMPVVAIRTQLDQGVLTWHTRYGLAFWLAAFVVVGRALLHVFYWNPRAARSLDVSTASKATAPATNWGEKIGPYVAPGLLAFGILLPLIAHIGKLYGVEIPNFGELRLIDLCAYILIYVMLGWGLNVVVGLAGLLDLGYVAFYAVGAYSYALLSTIYFPRWFGAGVTPYAFYITFPVAGLLAALWGVVLGFPVLRLRGDYLAIVTLAFGEIIRLVLINWIGFTGGPQGLSVPKITFFGLKFRDEPGGFADFVTQHFFALDFNPLQYKVFLYYLIFALALGTYFITKRLRRLPLGRAWEALREDEIACRSLGINTTNTKLTAFAIGAMFAGFAGCFFAARQEFITPESFIYIESALILAIVVLGGLGSQIGIVFSAIFIMGSFELFRELDFLKAVLPAGTEPIQFRNIAVGLAMVSMMLFRPRGFVTKREPTVYLKESKAISGDLVAEGHG